MGKINLLSYEVANLIAAGEVVDRPSSAVKELLENSIDAGATSVTLEIKRGGVKFIRVTDNGCGIAEDDLVPAITRHSTSKIKEASDLNSIFTLGFRGEALAALCSVSRMRIMSKLPESEMGAVLESEGGDNITITECGCQDGTTVIAEDLFFNVPARRKFLKKDATEAASVGAVIEKIALSHPEISFRFISDGELKFVTSGSGKLLDAVWVFFGKDVAKRSLEVSREENGIRITGYVSEPDFARPNRNMENFFINGRYIKSKTASAALEQAYASKIQADRFPFCVLNMEIDPGKVDVNVHPSKLEVKFSDEKSVFDAVYYAVLSALDSAAKRPDLPLPPRAAERVPETVASVPAKDYRSAFTPLDRKEPFSEQVRIQSEERTVPSARDSRPGPEGFPSFQASALREHAPHVPVPDTEPVPEAPAPEGADPYSVYDVPVTQEDIPDYRIIGEAWNCYVIVQLDDRLIMIDKHAAHERIIFDELCRNMRKSLRSGDRTSQMLLVPFETSVSEAEMLALNDSREKIEAMGFGFTAEKNGSASFRISVSEIPCDLTPEAAEELLLTLASKLSEGEGTVETSSAGFFETRLWQSACKAAIKGGRVYGSEHIKWICDRLLVKNGTSGAIRTCPHGRPVAFEIRKSSVDRQFSRIM